MFLVQGQRVTLKQLGQALYARVASGRALVDVGLTGCNGLCVGATPRVAALSALRLGQYGVNLIDES